MLIAALWACARFRQSRLALGQVGDNGSVH
jgi:hypothetical protein